MVPSGDIVVNIRIVPFASGQIEADGLVVSDLGIPSTIGVKLSISTENGVSSTSEGKGLESLDGFHVFPSLGLYVEAVDVIKRDAGVVQTTMSSIDVDLALVVASSSVSSRRRSVDRRNFVVTNSLVFLDTSPSVILAVEEPGVVETAGGRGVSSENEQSGVVSSEHHSNVLGTSLGLIGTLGILLLPNPFGSGQFESVDISDRHDLVSLGTGADSTVHEVFGITYEVH